MYVNSEEVNGKTKSWGTNFQNTYLKSSSFKNIIKSVGPACVAGLIAALYHRIENLFENFQNLELYKSSWIHIQIKNIMDYKLFVHNIN